MNRIQSCLTLTASILLASVAASPAEAQTRVHPLDNGQVTVSMNDCGVLFDRRGTVVSSGPRCSVRELREARRAHEAWSGGYGGPGGARDGVVLYRDEDYRGPSETFDRDVPNLRYSQIGNDSVTSLRVPRGCVVTVYSDADYRGRSATFERDVPQLGRTVIGNDTASSLRVDCRGGGHGSGYGGYDDGVTLYRDAGFRGTSETFAYDVSNLHGSRVGNDEVTSVRVPRGCVVVLYSDADFQGASLRITRDVTDLSRTPIGNDRLSSLTVDCR